MTRFVRRITGIFIVCLAVLLAAGIVVSFAQGGGTAVWSEIKLNDAYDLGAELQIPERTVSVGGEEKKADAVLFYPDSTATVADTVKLDRTGRYKIEYIADFNGKPYVKEEPFDVRCGILQYGENTQVSYGTPETAVTEGLLVNLAAGDTLTFTQYINVGDLTLDDVFCEFYVYPSQRGIADFDAVVFTLTDVEDPNVYLRIRAHRYVDHDSYAYFSAGGNGQPMVGYEWELDKIHVNNQFGLVTRLTFEARSYNWNTGVYADRASDAYRAQLRFDAEDLTVYCTDGGGTSVGGMITDLNDPKFFDSLWQGFQSGKAFLSVSGEGFRSDTANICFTNVAGTDLTQYTQPYVDTEEPVIEVDYEGELPEGRVGKAYPIPGAAAVDVYAGKCEVRTTVWYNYADPDRRTLVDMVNGSAVLEREGYYAVVYEATDHAGNTAREILWLHAGATIEDIAADPLPDAEVPLGQYLEIPSLSNLRGGSGELTVKIQVSLGDDVYSVESGFRFEQAGTWRVSYIVTDYTGETAEFGFNVTAAPDAEPVLLESPVLPRYLIAGVSYVIPEAYAGDYSSGSLTELLFDVYVTDKNGETKYTAGQSFVPEIENNGDKVAFSYRIGDTELMRAEVPAVVVWDEDGGLLLERYFVGEGYTVEKSDGGYLFSLSGTGSSWTFANPIAAEGLALRLGTIEGSGNFEKLIFTLTDAENAEISVRAELRQTGGRLYFSVQGGSPMSFAYTFGEEREIAVGFSQGGFVFENVPFPVSQTISGTTFGGFSSGKVYLTVEAQGIAGTAAYRVITLNGQTFTTSLRDRIAPSIVITEDYGGTYAPGDLYTIGAAIASDVLSPNVEFYLSVYDGENNIVTSEDGVRLENADPARSYTIRIDSYGQYRVEYTAQETSEFVPRPNTASLTYAINVEDTEAPVFTFEKGFRTQANVGDVYVIPPFGVSDDVTPAEQITVTTHVIDPNGALMVPSDGQNAFTCTYEGVYEIRMRAWDAAGNTKTVQVYVTVAAAGAET